MAEDLCLNLQNGSKLYVPNRLDAITTYVILEQERWFEKEWGFIGHLLAPGGVALDIGANLGIYSMAMARAVGPVGKVFAYEPTSATRARLERSKAANMAANLVVLGSALSDTEREGRIVFGPSSELNHITDDPGGEGEAVHLTSLDLEARRHGWGPIDFIKMDAEGEELKIIAGGKSVFQDRSPVVMFEIRVDAGVDPALPAAFEEMGYGLYQLLPDERHLVPFDRDALDGQELNLFAIKPDREAELAGRGLLASEATAAQSGSFAALAQSLPFTKVFPALFAADASDVGYAAALDDYAGWRDETRPLSGRISALRRSQARLADAVETGPTPARLMSLARASADMGRRTYAVGCIRDCLKLLEGGATIGEPFLSPTDRHESLKDSPQVWLVTACIEAFERGRGYSSFYGAPLPQLDWVSRTSLCSYEMERRRVLAGMARGQPVEMRKNLALPAPDHLNAATWARLIGQ